MSFHSKVHISRARKTASGEVVSALQAILCWLVQSTLYNYSCAKSKISCPIHLAFEKTLYKHILAIPSGNKQACVIIPYPSWSREVARRTAK